MFEDWNSLEITKIGLAIYVAPGTGSTVHTNRPLHGLVFNGIERMATYCFHDGFALKTYENSLFYLPKGSSYKVIPQRNGEGCWAINFDLAEEPEVAPFSLKIQNRQQILSDFKASVDAFLKSGTHRDLAIRKNLYDILLLLKKEQEKTYTTGKKALLIKPALDFMGANYTKNDLSVEKLSRLCGISVAYFRRIFTEKYGISPKEYIMNKKMEYAKKLLASKQFSVGEVAELCGYSEPCHFSREFSKRTGTSPIKYK